jgi:hypothetical protein
MSNIKKGESYGWSSTLPDGYQNGLRIPLAVHFHLHLFVKSHKIVCFVPPDGRNVNKYESTFRAPRKYNPCPTKVYFVAVSIYSPR